MKLLRFILSAFINAYKPSADPNLFGSKKIDKVAGLARTRAGETQGEIDAASSTVRDSDGPVLKQEMGITDEQVEKMKQEEEYAKHQADDKKRKASEEEKAENNEKFTQQKKLGFSFLRRELSNSDVTTSEVVQTQKEIEERRFSD